MANRKLDEVMELLNKVTEGQANNNNNNNNNNSRFNYRF